MRRLLLFAILGACGKPTTTPPPVIAGAPAPAPHVALPLAAPSVTVASAVAQDPKRVPALVILDDKGLSVAVPPASWAELGAYDASRARLVARPGKMIHEAADALGKLFHEDVALGRSSDETIKQLGEMREMPRDNDDRRLTTNGNDDPPPPPEEEDAGGTGTAMALDEGKMGKKDSDRAEGQYKMSKHPVAPAPPPPGPRWGDPKNVDEPERQAVIAGRVPDDGVLVPEQRAVILASPTTKAAVLIDVLGQIEGLIGVRYQGMIRPLRLDFLRRDRDIAPAQGWVELRVGAGELAFEAVPDKPRTLAWTTGALDQLAFTKEHAATLALRSLDATTTVDVLVDPAIDAQRLIDVLVALDGAGVRSIGLGLAPTGPQAALRGHRTPVAMIGVPNAQGDLDKKLIRTTVKAHTTEIQACYEAGLIKQPGLHGVVMVQFFISPKGTVASAAANGVDPVVSGCIAGVIKKLAFPKPKGGGGVQVNYPFSLHD